MMFSLPLVSTEHFVLGIMGLVLLSIVSQKLPGALHKWLVSFVSLLVIVVIDSRSALILLIFANIGYGFIAKGASRKTIQTTAWALIAVLMSYKGFQALSGEHSSSFIALVGVSYYTFRIASTLFDIARGSLKKPGYTDFMLYCLFFPVFAGGPVQRYNAFSRNSDSVDANLLGGLYRIGRALIKKILIADIILLFFISWVESQLTGDQTFSAVKGDDRLTWKVTNTMPVNAAVLLYGFLNILRAYYDLSAFTDLALGLARLFGYNISGNFNRPFIARNMIDFWRRWHLTIAGWAKDYVFSPIMLSTRSLAGAVFLTMVAMGLWHELSAKWLFWGVCHGLGLIACGWWQRTRPSQTLVKLERDWRAQIDRAFCQDNSYMGRYIPNMARAKMSYALMGSVSFVFFLPAWLITFGYMSLVFVAVSRPDLASALDFYSLIYRGEL